YRYRLADADRHLARWLAQVPDSTLALLAAGKLAELREQYNDAVTVFSRVLELDPEFDEVRLRLTTNLLRLSKPEDALPHLQYLQRRRPDHPQVGQRVF